MEACWELHQGILGKLHVISETESSRNEGHYFISPVLHPKPTQRSGSVYKVVASPNKSLVPQKIL